ncbi:HTH_Tnp_Tc3_2 domain-containing protein [Trichonephila clavipes]|nr:HTH_Tnp_Tc3_2 domain-containing protein [Trichonephila clavipes]
MPHHRIRAHYEQQSEFESGRIIGLKKGGWANRRVARYMGRSNAAITRCCQEWVDNGRFRRYDGSGQYRPSSDQEYILIVRSTVSALDPSLSTIRRMTRTRVSTMILHRLLIEQNLRSYRPLRNVPFTPTHNCSGACIDQVGILVTGYVKCITTNATSISVLTIIEDVSIDGQGSVQILLSLLHATHALNKELCSGVPFF